MTFSFSLSLPPELSRVYSSLPPSLSSKFPSFKSSSSRPHSFNISSGSSLSQTSVLKSASEPPCKFVKEEPQLPQCEEFQERYDIVHSLIKSTHPVKKNQGPLSVRELEYQHDIKDLEFLSQNNSSAKLSKASRSKKFVYPSTTEPKETLEVGLTDYYNKSSYLSRYTATCSFCKRKLNYALSNNCFKSKGRVLASGSSLSSQLSQQTANGWMDFTDNVTLLEHLKLLAEVAEKFSQSTPSALVSTNSNSTNDQAVLTSDVTTTSVQSRPTSQRPPLCTSAKVRSLGVGELTITSQSRDEEEDEKKLSKLKSKKNIQKKKSRMKFRKKKLPVRLFDDQPEKMESQQATGIMSFYLQGHNNHSKKNSKIVETPVYQARPKFNFAEYYFSKSNVDQYSLKTKDERRECFLILSTMKAFNEHTMRKDLMKRKSGNVPSTTTAWFPSESQTGILEDMESDESVPSQPKLSMPIIGTSFVNHKPIVAERKGYKPAKTNSWSIKAYHSPSPDSDVILHRRRRLPNIISSNSPPPSNNLTLPKVTESLLRSMLLDKPETDAQLYKNLRSAAGVQQHVQQKVLVRNSFNLENSLKSKALAAANNDMTAEATTNTHALKSPQNISLHDQSLARSNSFTFLYTRPTVTE